MEPVPSCSGPPDDFTLEVNRLLEVFGSSFSLEDIVSTLKQANCNIDRAGEILSTLQSTSSSSDVYHPGEEQQQTLTPSTRSIDNNISQKLKLDETNGTDLNNKDHVTLACLPGTTERGIDEFLLKMLGCGFQLDTNVIHEVLGACKYDMSKTMEMLLDLSASTLEKSDDVLSKPFETPSHSFQDPVSFSCKDKLENPYHSGPKNKRKHGKTDRERELLLTLFTTKKSEEVQTKNVSGRGVRRSGAYGTLVAEPPKDPTINHTMISVQLLHDSGNGGEDGISFQNLRLAVKEHWASMKEYYISAVEAFIKGDNARAYRLVEQGQFFSRMAREADEKSIHMMMETKDEEVLLDLTIHEPKEAIKLLSIQLSNLCGIPSIPYIKVKVVNGDKDRKERLRKQWILKYLEKEAVKWSESENGQMIIIRVDGIDPESFTGLK